MTNITNPSDRAYALSYLNDIIDNQEYINSLKVGKSQDSIDGFDTYNSIISLSDLPNNKYSDTYSKYVNQIFGDSSSIRQYFNNDDVYNSFINAIGGEKKAASLGVRFGSDGNGYRYAELPKDYHGRCLVQTWCSPDSCSSACLRRSLYPGIRRLPRRRRGADRSSVPAREPA